MHRRPARDTRPATCLAATTWYSITCSMPGISSGAICLRRWRFGRPVAAAADAEENGAAQANGAQDVGERVLAHRCEPVSRSSRADDRSSRERAKQNGRRASADDAGSCAQDGAERMSSPVRQHRRRFLHSPPEHAHELIDLLYARPATFDQLRWRRCRGASPRESAAALLSAGDAGYEDARKVWNGTVDRRPAMIARCLSAERRPGGGPLRGRRTHAAQRARRRPSYRRQRGCRRRPDDRSLGDACGRRRRCEADGAGRRRRAAQGCRSRRRRRTALRRRWASTRPPASPASRSAAASAG